MIKNKKLQNKKALEFVLTNRGMDDPHYNDPNAPAKVLLHVPKEDSCVNKDHEKILDMIPEINRGTYTEENDLDKLREMGIQLLEDEDKINEVREKLSQMNKDKFIKETKSDLEDDKLDLILKHAKINADIVEYNEYGLKKDIDPEILEYVTNKEFREGVDIFIPAPGSVFLEDKRFDIDIQPEDMNEEYKEMYDELMKDEIDEEKVKGDIEDDFILMANEGRLPIELQDKMEEMNTDFDKKENSVKNSKNAKPAKNTQPGNGPAGYKYITKEEKEFLDKQFDKMYNKEYKIEDSLPVKSNPHTKVLMEEAMNELLGSKHKTNNLNSKFDDEDEFEDYELDEGEEYEDEQFEDCPVEEEEEEKNYKIDNQIEKFTEKQQKKKRKVSVEEVFTLKELDELIKNDENITKTVEMFENQENQKNSEPENEEYLPEYEPKRRLDITAVHGKIGVAPKTIGRIEHTERPKQTHSNKDQIEIIKSKPEINDTLDNRLRKKLLKEEKREKRKQKKELKTVFKDEKTKLQKHIANTNSVIRYGISVREL
jgi:hypothetical protein